MARRHRRRDKALARQDKALARKAVSPARGRASNHTISQVSSKAPGRRALLLGTALVSAGLLGTLAAPLPAAAQVRDCVQLAPPTPIDDFSNAEAITCVNTEPRTADGVPPGENDAISIETVGDDLFITLHNSGELTTNTTSPSRGIDLETDGERSFIEVTNSARIDVTTDAPGDGIRAEYGPR